MHKLAKNIRLKLFTYVELIFAFAVSTVVMAVNLSYKKGSTSIETYIILNIFSCFALFVTALGITGIQLIQIYRKKNEIGLRRAVGAKGLDIVLMILKDTTLLIIIPALLGILLGVVLSDAVPIYELFYVKPVMDYRVVLYNIIVIAIFTMASCAIPAYMASKLHILEALRNNRPIDKVKSKKNITWGFYLIMAAVIVISGLINYRLEEENKKDIINMTGSPPAVMELVPSFSFKDQDGKVISSETLKGRSYCLVIYDITCPIATTVIEDLQELVEKGSLAMEDIIPICIDGTLKETKEYVRKNNLNIMAFIDYKKSTKWAFKSNLIPTIYLIGKDGVIHARSFGWTEELKQYITSKVEEGM